MPILSWDMVPSSIRWAIDAFGLPTVVLIGVVSAFELGWIPIETTYARVMKTQEILTEHQQVNEELHKEIVDLLKEQVKHLRAICFNTAVYDRNLMRKCGEL